MSSLERESRQRGGSIAQYKAALLEFERRVMPALQKGFDRDNDSTQGEKDSLVAGAWVGFTIGILESDAVLAAVLT